MSDWLIEAARRPVKKCEHEFNAPNMFCIHCRRSAEDILNSVDPYWQSVGKALGHAD